MKDMASINKLAWEYKVYEWRIQNQGTPSDVAKKILCSPKSFLRYHSTMFHELENKKVASICGSDGRRAVAFAVLGAEATVFDNSEPQKEYALQLAEAANVSIKYEIGDFCSIDTKHYQNYFDYAYCEGGILHYFHDIAIFFDKIYKILKPKGMLILSDYHPFQKTTIVDIPKRNIELTGGDYFDNRIHDGHVPYAKYFTEEEQKFFPGCSLRFYTLSEIINSVINAGLILQAFFEHPKLSNPKIPAEFTIIATKNEL